MTTTTGNLVRSEPADMSGDESFIVRFEAYEGPIDALLDLARAQRIDLSAIDMVELADQFEKVVARAISLRLELAADWLVMAAWLAYLKSRDLLRKPKHESGNEEADADALALQLRRLDAVKTAADALLARRRLGVDWFAPAPHAVAERNRRMDADLYELLRAYGRSTQREVTELASPTLTLKPFDLSSVDAALGLVREKTRGRDWTDLLLLVPAASGLRLRSNIATCLVAGLELARGGSIELKQEADSDPVMVRDGERHG